MQSLIEADFDRIKGMNADVFSRLKAQAKIQKESFGKDIPLYQILPHEDHKKMGLALLPAGFYGSCFLPPFCKLAASGLRPL